MSRKIMQQALSAFEAIMFEKDAESCQIIARNARYALREELAKPEQELDYPPECTTPELEVAYAAGWWKALEVQRNKQQALDKKAENARELGLDYEPDHGFDRTASHMAGEYVDTAKQKPVGWFTKDWQGVYVELMPGAEDAIPLYTAPPNVHTNQQNVNTSEERVYKMCICEHIQRCTVFDKCMKEC